MSFLPRQVMACDMDFQGPFCCGAMGSWYYPLGRGIKFPTCSSTLLCDVFNAQIVEPSMTNIVSIAHIPHRETHATKVLFVSEAQNANDHTTSAIPGMACLADAQL